MNLKLHKLIALISLFFIVYVKASESKEIWKPKAGTTWNWAIGEEDQDSIPIEPEKYDVIDIDLFNTSEETIEKMHDAGLKVICYFCAGTFEVGREESKDMKKVDGLIKDKMDGWDEYWLDFRKSEIKDFMRDFLDIAKEKKCDGVEFDNVDAFDNVDWVTEKEQKEYNIWLANEAHKRYLSAGLKNCLGLIEELEEYFDFAVNEECTDYDECGEYSPFLENDKAVFTALYGSAENSKFMSKVCKGVKGLNLSVIIKDLELHYDFVALDYEKHCGGSLGVLNDNDYSSSATKNPNYFTLLRVKKPSRTRGL